MFERQVHVGWRAQPSAWAALGASLLITTPARARPACVIRPPPSHAESAWVSAWKGVDERVRAQGGSSTCSTLELQMRSDRIEVVLTTLDGRRAVREVQEPFELAATADAMLLTLDPPSMAVEAAPTLPSVTASVESTDNRSSRDARSQDKVPTALSRITLGGLGGVRVGGGVATPIVDLVAALTAPPWEVGVIGQWEIAYQSLGHPIEQRWSGSGLAAGISAARHQLVGSYLDLIGGARLEGVILHQETNHRHPEEWMMKADGRVGVYVGAVLPRRSPIRFRAELAIDTLLEGAPPPASPELPSLPSWAASIAIGVEANGP